MDFKWLSDIKKNSKFDFAKVASGYEELGNSFIDHIVDCLGSADAIRVEFPIRLGRVTGYIFDIIKEEYQITIQNLATRLDVTLKVCYYGQVLKLFVEADHPDNFYNFMMAANITMETLMIMYIEK